MSETKVKNEIEQTLKALAKPPREWKYVDRTRPGWETSEKRQNEAFAKDRKARRKAQQLLGLCGGFNA